MIRIYLAPDERIAIEKRVGSRTSIADLVRNFLEGDSLVGSPRQLPLRKPDTGRRKRLKVRVPREHKQHAEDAARDNQTTLSDYVVRRLLALPETPEHRRARTKLTNDHRRLLQLELVAKRLDELWLPIRARPADPGVKEALQNLTEAIQEMRPGKAGGP